MSSSSTSPSVALLTVDVEKADVNWVRAGLKEESRKDCRPVRMAGDLANRETVRGAERANARMENMIFGVKECVAIEVVDGKKFCFGWTNIS